MNYHQGTIKSIPYASYSTIFLEGICTLVYLYGISYTVVKYLSEIYELQGRSGSEIPCVLFTR